MNHVSSILKRPGVKDDNDDGGEEEGEEESAYNEHFKKNAGKPGPGEFRVPSIRVRPTGAPPTITSQPTSQAQDYTGTATEQGKGNTVLHNTLLIWKNYFMTFYVGLICH